MYQFLLITFGTIAGSIPVVTFLLLFAIGGWILSVRSLGKQFTSLTTEPASAPEEKEASVVV